MKRIYEVKVEAVGGGNGENLYRVVRGSIRSALEAGQAAYHRDIRRGNGLYGGGRVVSVVEVGEVAR